jgi:pimeloyl-ACP methyl ester carboxylesterase
MTCEPKGRGAAWTPREPKGAAPTGLRSDEGATREGGASRAPGGERDNRASGTVEHWPGELVSLDDHQVYVRSVPDDVGQPARREPALCVHGLAGSSRNWTDLMDLLRPRLAADALDLPGFGDSPPRPDGRYSIAAMAQTVTALIQRRGRSPVHLIANSLGGAVAVKVAATRPELIKTLTLISPALPDSRPRLDLIRFPLISLPRVGARLLRKYQALPPEIRVADVIATCYSDPARFPRTRFAVEVTELARRDTLDYATAALVGSVRTLTAEFFRMGRHTAWRDAARITAPCLVIYGSHDRLVDPRLAGRAARAFPGARILVLPRTGHLAHMEHPAQVAAEIGVLLGNSRPLQPVDRGAGRDARAPAR